MARIEHIQRRLVAWGAWKSRSENHGLGFARTNILLSLGGGGSAGYREAVVPIDEIEAAETDRAVESLRLVKSHLYLTLQHIYVRNAGVAKTAAAMGRARATIHAQLDQADAEIDRWLRERSDKRAARAAV